MDDAHKRPPIGVAIVTYRPGPIVLECLESLMASQYGPMKIVICDNASPDNTVDALQVWLAENGFTSDIYNVTAEADTDSGPLGPITLLKSNRNLGFAGGVNVCLRTLAKDETINHFWVLNPDCTVPPSTPHLFADAIDANGEIGILGGRIVYKHSPTIIQSDGGRVNLWTGVCRNLNYGADVANVVPPSTDRIDFVVGASVVVSRRFVETVGYMEEGYFLFYEEVDWALQRGELPLHYSHDAVIYHEGGTATGSASFKRRASPVTNYFQYRNRMRFVARFKPWALPIAYAVSALKLVKLVTDGGDREELSSAFRGLHQMAPPKTVLSKLGPTADLG